MKIAIPVQNGTIDPRLGEAKTFWIIETDGSTVRTRETATASGEGNISAVSLLAAQQVDTLICGEIGLMARNALQMIELTLVPGCTGDAEQALQNFLSGKAQGDPSILDVEIPMDENDPMQCMHDCAKCSGCGDPEMLEIIQKHIPEA